MLVIEDKHRNITYHIRLVPMDEALRMKQNGQVFYDFTKLTAINTCPTWGVLRYGLHRTEIPLTASGRMLAVECGKACHDFFAALRLWTLLERAMLKPRDGTDVMKKGIEYHAYVEHGIKLFGQDRMNEMLAVPQDSDRVNNAQLFALSALHTSGYYDDPSDRKRTMANMETSCLAYADRYLASDQPVLVRGDIIGIEIPFVLEVVRVEKASFKFSDGSKAAEEIRKTVQYYCGRIDGIHQFGDYITVGENKTAATLSSTWRQAFAISHQITGYTIAGTCILGEEVYNAQVMGVQIPLPRDPFNGVVFHPETRTESDRLRWCEWFFDSIRTYEEYIARPHEAPRYSHSCNRYFSACQFIPYCSLTREEQIDALSSMRVDEWSPLDHLTEGDA